MFLKQAHYKPTSTYPSSFSFLPRCCQAIVRLYTVKDNHMETERGEKMTIGITVGILFVISLTVWLALFWVKSGTEGVGEMDCCYTHANKQMHARALADTSTYMQTRN